jgi:radical SAM protein with 4Fe4S-binding SPASM domain
MGSPDPFVSFAPGVVYRGLETPHLFHVLNDELYELDDDGLFFIDEVDGSRRKSEVSNRELLDYSESEGLLDFSEEPAERPLARGSSPLPSLRYLELIITLRCNLRCRHCYLDEPKNVDMAPDLLSSVLSEFDEMQGLRLLLSGGEPLLYPHLDRLAKELSGRGYRVVLLTNGLSLNPERLNSLPVHEIQVSIDGMEQGHDYLRGAGGFKRAVEAARLATDSGRGLSVATMIHANNLFEMDELENLVKDLGAREWSLDVPCEAGRWAVGDSEAVSYEEAAAAMARGYGGSYHGSSAGYACGLHLASVMPDGDVCRCGFYSGAPLGNAGDGLRKAWVSREPLYISELDWCRDCEAAPDCGGGCRFRAGGAGPDPVMCAVHGWPKGRAFLKPGAQ